MARQEDFLFAERALQRGYATEEQVQECLSLLERLRSEMKLEESLGNLMVKKGYLAPAQAHVLDAEISPNRADRPKNAIEGYRLLQRIGSGAMGSVYKADHLKLKVPVALKVLRPSLASSRTQIERLKREAQLAARLSHPNVVRSLDVGESNGFHYLAMEFVEGATIRDLISKGPVPEKDALAIVRQVASGLAHAHAKGVVHRDVKPGNIMLTPDGTAKITDFGLARGQGPSDLTLDHASIGTPQYVAPEQMRRGKDATTRSDLFSIGATLYHMVTGRPPFDGENLGEIVQNVLACRFEPPERLNPELSRDTVYVIDRLLRANPRERYASAAELVLDLERIGRGEPVAPPDFLGDYHQFLRKRRGRRNTILAGVALVLVVAGAFLLQRERTRRAREQLEARCRATAAVGEDAVGRANTTKQLDVAIKAMVAAKAGARNCDGGTIASLDKRLAMTRAASDILADAERGFSEASTPGADYRGIYQRFVGIETGLAGVDDRIRNIRKEIEGLSYNEATSRHKRAAFDDAVEVMREVRAFAEDLQKRYLAIDEPWVADVRQAPGLLDTFDAAWTRLNADRKRFDDALKEGAYGNAADLLDDIRRGEENARRALFENPYLARLASPLSRQPLAFRTTDARARELREQEDEAWEKVRRAAEQEMQASPPHPEKAEDSLAGFLLNAHGTRKDVSLLLAEAGRQRMELEAEQNALYVQDEELFKTRMRGRAYAQAYDDVAAVSGAAKWLPALKTRYDALQERAAAVAELPQRFLKGARKQKTVPVRGVEVQGKEIEAAPGTNRDLFVGRRGKERFEFTLADLNRKTLREILAFDPGVAEDRSLAGWFDAAEAFAEDQRDPTKALALRESAVNLLPKGDPWLRDTEVALQETQKRIEAGEKRAKEADAEFRAAVDAGQHMKALSLCRELLSLKWTEFVKNRVKEYSSELEKLQRVASLQLLPIELGVPRDQVTYAGDKATIGFTGKRWCPLKVAPDATPEQIEDISRRYWDDWFRSKGVTEKQELNDLFARAITQRLSWKGDVEVAGPEGGYRPGPQARMTVRDWDPGAGQAPTRPQPILLDFPFLKDRPWSIEATVRWPTPHPGYFAIACGQVQAVFGYYRGASEGGGMKGACLVESEGMDPGGFRDQLEDLQWYRVDPWDPKEKKDRRRLTGGEKAYLDEFTEEAPYRVRLERRADNTIVFEMWPLEQRGAKRIHLERKYTDARKLDRLVTLADGHTAFRFFGAPPGDNLAYEIFDVEIAGILGAKRDVE